MASSVLHEGEPVVDEALVSRLLRHQFPEFADLALRPAPTSGSGNRIFRLGDEFSVRLPRHPRAAEHIGKENTWLPRLAEQLSLQVPRPFRVGAAADGFPWPWAIHRWIDASVAVPERLDLKRAARELAQFIGQLRRVDARGGPPASRGRPLCSRDVDTRSAIEQLAGTIDTAAARDVWVRALRAPLWSGPPRWLHADLHAANLLVRDDRIIAVIDFGSCGVGGSGVRPDGRLDATRPARAGGLPGRGRCRRGPVGPGPWMGIDVRAGRAAVLPGQLPGACRDLASDHRRRSVRSRGGAMSGSPGPRPVRHRWVRPAAGQAPWPI